MKAEYGSLAWAARRDAHMTVAERIAEALAGAKALALDRAGRLAGIRPREVNAMVREIDVPLSRAVTAAEAELAGAEPWILPHSMRTYLFGTMIGIRDGLRADSEGLLLASLLHDVGLVHRGGADCFAHRGAMHARALVAATADSGLADRVADAICAHLDVRPATFSAEAALLRAGAGLDVAGSRFDHIARNSRLDVVRAWPREGFADAVTAALRGEAERHPGTRAAFLCGALRFPTLIAQADRRFQADSRARDARNASAL